MNKFAILGSGFGLYGYLPALIHSGQKIVLPYRYQTRFNHRNELNQFADQITWCTDEINVLKFAQGVTLAVNPDQQVYWLPICLKSKNIGKLILEKPLAPSPAIARQILNTLKKSHLPFRISYLFRYTVWGKWLLSRLKSDSVKEITLEWRFMAHHFQHEIVTWKRQHNLGGGVIRFYGIHFIALLAELGYQNVILSEVRKLNDEYIAWRAIFSGNNLPDCHIMIDTQSLTSSFRLLKINQVNQHTIIMADLSDPFQSYVSSPKTDTRIPFLANSCQSLLNETVNYYQWYFSTIDLWDEVEKNIKYC